jgi:murein tripeptide amidase MpaA
MSYLNVDEVDSAVQSLAAAYPALTQLITLPFDTVEGRTSHALRIGAGAAGSRDVLMVIGGQHAREWGSCEICINFAADLLEAYDTGTGLAYGGTSFSAAQVQGIVDTLHLVVFPLVNPDGRHFSQTADGDWRRNRNPAQSGGSPSCVGVDLNRNYDFLFDFKNTFHPTAYSPANWQRLVVSDDPCATDQTYHGPSAFSEAETRNVRWLLDAFPRTRWFFDVHSYSELILYNWGDDNNQTTEPARNFRNPAFDDDRGLLADAAYAEYVPAGDALIAQTLAERMRDTIAAVRGKTYTAKQSVGLYPTCGTSQDYAYSRHFVDPGKGKTYSYTIEWGTQFQPDWPEMELIIQDVTAGLIDFCVAAPCAGGLIGVTLDTPSLPFIDVPAGEETVRAAVFTIQTCSAVTMQVQPPTPVVTAGPGSFGLPLGAVESLPASASAAPREIRIWVSHTGTSPLDVTTGSITIRCVETAQDFVIPITANTIAQPKVASVLVLDRSASMDWASGLPGKKRIDVLHDAAPVYVQLLPDDHGIGVVAFDHEAYPVKPVLQADAGGRTAANTGIGDHMPNPAGNTAIGDGVELAHDTLEPLAGYDHKATVVFTDGHETAAKYIAEVAPLINERVFALGLGTADQLDPIALSALVNNTDGYLLLTGNLASHDDLRVEKYFSQIQAGVSNAEVVVDPEGSLLPGATHRIPFAITESDRAASVFLLSAAPWVFDFRLETPHGDLIDPVAAAALPAVEFSLAPRVSLYRMTLPVPVGVGAKQGTWHAVLKISRDDFRKYLSANPEAVVSTSSAAHGVRYSLNVHTFSSLRMKAQVVQSGYEPGATLALRAELTESGLPVEQRASVRADVQRPNGASSTLALAEIEPGVFESSLAASMAGIYPIRFRARGTTLRGHPFTREQLRTAAVWRGGNGTPPTGTTPPSRPGVDWCQLVACLLEQRSVLAWLEKHGIDADAIRRCWKQQCGDDAPRASLRAALLANPALLDLLARLERG